MHVASTLFSDMFAIEVHGREGSISDVFPDWRLHERFGILIDSPLGALGATNLIQIATTSFYDVKPIRRSEKKVYPELYAIHIGEDYGAFIAFDLWPARREVIVSRDHKEVLGALNDRAITRLAIPDRPQRDLAHRPKEVDTALETISSAIVYSESGRVKDPDFSITGKDRRTEYNPGQVIRPPRLTAPPVNLARVAGRRNKESEPDYQIEISRRYNAVSEAQRVAAAARREELTIDGGVRETYRFISVEDALKRL